MYLISSEAQNLALENQNIFFKDYPGEECYFSGEMDFSGLPRNSLVKSLVVRRNRWHLYQDSGADSKWRRIYDGRERLAPQLSHPLAPARRTARKQVIPSGVQSFRFGDG